MEKNDSDALDTLKDELINRAGVSLNERKGVTALLQYVSDKLDDIDYKEFEGEPSQGGDSISRKTLTRIFGKEKSPGKLSIRTLNILARVMGCKHWNDYKNRLLSSQKSLFNPEFVRVEELEEGKTLILGWPDEYFVKVRYLGKWNFEVLENKGINWQVGMQFIAQWFQLSYCYTVNEEEEGYELHPQLINRTEKKGENEEYIIY